MPCFGKILKNLRTKNDLTQVQLADALGLAFSTISMYERGEREPDFEILESIADYFNVTMDYLHGKSTVENPIRFLSFTPDPNAKMQKFIVFSKNGPQGARENILPSNDVLNEINKLAKALRPYPAEQINALLQIVENGGNIPINADLPQEVKDLISTVVDLPPEKVSALIQVAKGMK